MTSHQTLLRATSTEMHLMTRLNPMRTRQTLMSPLQPHWSPTTWKEGLRTSIANHVSSTVHTACNSLLAVGRPRTFSSAAADAEYPDDTERHDDGNGDIASRPVFYCASNCVRPSFITSIICCVLIPHLQLVFPAFSSLFSDEQGSPCGRDFYVGCTFNSNPRVCHVYIFQARRYCAALFNVSQS